MRKPVRILYDLHPHTIGGIERFMARFLARLNKRRYEPLVISQKNGKPLQLIKSLGIQTEVMPDYFREPGIKQMADFIRAHRIELVQSNYYAANLALAANQADVPHIWRVGGHVDIGSGVTNERDVRWTLDIMKLLSKTIICNSYYVRSQFRGRSKYPSIHTIQNGIPVTAHAHRVNKTGSLRIGMIAHLTSQKRHLDFIEAAEIISQTYHDVSFAIVGSSYDSPASRRYVAKVQSRSKKLQQQGKLTILEFFTSENEIVNSFDIVIQPSIQESFSNAILEAMAAGIPVIAARSGGHTELIEHRKTGLLFTPEQPESLARAISMLIKNREQMSQMGQAARKRAQTLFSMKRCVRAYEDIYSKVISDFPR
ncbi:MAG TPA: glycosyltransferase family 4 protein [Blastocatellia bacterium]|nr:glycosyltransferase family 4 protein [Blastocatellia bacterium]